jgi:hypothetical protein
MMREAREMVEDLRTQERADAAAAEVGVLVPGHVHFGDLVCTCPGQLLPAESRRFVRSGPSRTSTAWSRTATPEEPWWPVGVDESAVRVGVTRNAVVTWRQRSRTRKNVPRFPQPGGRISGRLWCWWADIEVWAIEAGRLPVEDPPGPVYRPRR